MHFYFVCKLNLFENFKLKYLFTIILFFSFLKLAECQVDNDLVQFSGVIVTADSLKPVPFTHIIVDKTNRGTTSDYYGFFTIVVKKGESLIFSATGFKRDTYKVPDTLRENRYSIVHVMTADTIMLSGTVVYPWPTKENFKHTFLTQDIPDDDIEIAKKNIALMEKKGSHGRNYDPEKFGFTPHQSYRNQMIASAEKLYYKGQQAPNNLLNPIAWAKFIKAWQNGDFKRKDK